jgi:hypothetical protein
VSVQACPVDVCITQIPMWKLMCQAHWAMVPIGMQRRVYAAWNRRLKASRELPIGSPGWQEVADAHTAVKEEAVKFVNERLAARASG